MAFQQLMQVPLVRTVLRRVVTARIREKLTEIRPYIRPADRILDVGSGNGLLGATLRQYGHQVTALDVRNGRFPGGLPPVLYDGVRMPFADGAFDVALLITMLHHTPQPEQILAEARRVATRLIVVEETYANVVEQYVTYGIDSVFNLEFRGHPHTNKTDTGWRQAFRALGLSVRGTEYGRSLGVLSRVTYVLT